MGAGYPAHPTGLGLAVVKRIVEARHKGMVRVESVKDRGADFYYIDLAAHT